MSEKTLKVRVAGYDRYFLLFDLCCALFVASATMNAVGIENDWVTALEVGWALVLLALFSRKRRDEFAEHCWRTATSATFVMLLIAPTLWSFGAGIWHGFNDLPKVEHYELPIDAILGILFATFFVRFQWTRFVESRG